MSKVALVVNTLSTGGAEKMLSNLSRFLPEEVEVEILVNDGENVVYPYRGNLIHLNLPARGNRMGFGYQLRLLLRRTAVLRRLKKEKGYDAVIAYSESANVANILSGRAALPGGGRTKRILSVHTSLPQRKKNYPLFGAVGNVCMRLLYNRADCVVAVSREIGEELQRIGGVRPEKIRVIYNGIDRSELHRVPYEQADFGADDPIGAKLAECKAAGIPVLCNVGRLARSKGQRHLLRALAELKKQGQPFFLFVFGIGTLREPLEALAEELGLTGQVMFCGFVKGVHRYLQYADAEVCSSLSEGYSNALIEAQALGVPVVSTDHPTGAREILAPKTDHRQKCTEPEEAEFGILTPVCDGNAYTAAEPLTKEEEYLARAIREMLIRPELRQKYRELGLARTDINMEQVAEKWMELLQEDEL